MKYILVAEAFYLVRLYFKNSKSQADDGVEKDDGVEDGNQQKASKDVKRKSAARDKEAPSEDVLNERPPLNGDIAKKEKNKKTIERDSQQDSADEEDTLNINYAIFFPDLSIVVPEVPSRRQQQLEGINSIQHDPNMWWNIPNFFEKRSTGPLKDLIEVLRGTKKTLDLAMYVISFPPLSDILIELRRRWVDVRLIADAREDEALKSQVQTLKHAGIKIRCNEHSYSSLMHNKFVVIDNEILLTGSFNWTKNAVLCNHDNILITSQPKLVKEYAEEFDTLWSKFLPYQPR